MAPVVCTCTGGAYFCSGTSRVSASVDGQENYRPSLRATANTLAPLGRKRAGCDIDRDPAADMNVDVANLETAGCAGIRFFRLRLDRLYDAVVALDTGQGRACRLLRAGNGAAGQRQARERHDDRVLEQSVHPITIDQMEPGEKLQREPSPSGRSRLRNC